MTNTSNSGLKKAKEQLIELTEESQGWCCEKLIIMALRLGRI